jgi:hypothetical protein
VGVVCVVVGGCVWVGVRVAFLSQRAKHMRVIVLSSVAFVAPPYFSTLSHKLQDFKKTVIEHKTRVLIFSTSFM